MLSDDERQILVSKLETVREELVTGSVAEIYRNNPFWEARYGARGARHAHKDSHYNLNYLISAIRIDAPSTLTQYYHWLRGALVFRGMCTQHIYDTLDTTGRHLARLLPDEWAQIRYYYQAGYEGLAYDHPACQAITSAADKIALETADRLTRASGATIDEQAKASRVRDILYILSFLTDAIGMDNQDIFLNYLEWVTGLSQERGEDPTALSETLTVMGEIIQSSLPEDLASPFVNLLQKSLTA